MWALVLHCQFRQAFSLSRTGRAGKINTRSALKSVRLSGSNSRCPRCDGAASPSQVGLICEAQPDRPGKNRQLADKVADLERHRSANEARLKRDKRIIVWKVAPARRPHRGARQGDRRARGSGVVSAFRRGGSRSIRDLDLERPISALARRHGDSISAPLDREGCAAEVQGRRPVVNTVIVRFINLGEARAAQALLKTETINSTKPMGTSRAPLEIDRYAGVEPRWRRPSSWVDMAYAKAVDVPDRVRP